MAHWVSEIYITFHLVSWTSGGGTTDSLPHDHYTWPMCLIGPIGCLIIVGSWPRMTILTFTEVTMIKFDFRRITPKVVELLNLKLGTDTCPGSRDFFPFWSGHLEFWSQWMKVVKSYIKHHKLQGYWSYQPDTWYTHSPQGQQDEFAMGICNFSHWFCTLWFEGHIMHLAVFLL